MVQRKSVPAFRSIRVLGEKAQRLLRLARKRAEAEGPPPHEMKALPEGKKAELTVGFLAGNVAQATLVVLGILVGGWMLYALSDKIILLLLGFFVAAIIDPGVVVLERRGIPRGLGVLIHYFVAVFLFVFLLVSLIPILADQLQEIASLISAHVNAFLANPTIHIPLLPADVNDNLTELVRGTLENLSVDRFADTLQSLGQSLASFAGGSFLFATRIGLTVVGFFVRLIIVLVLAFFIQMEKEHIRLWVRAFFPVRARRYLDTKTDAVHVKIGKWARGQLLLSLCIGLLVFVALIILGIDYAATLAVLAAFTEFIPYVGPFAAAVPAVLIALTDGGIVWAIIVAGMYYVIQWCENNLLVPLIMKRAVGLSPIAIIFAMLVGVSFPDIIHPILGILLAVPSTTIITLFLEDWQEWRRGG